MGEALDLTELQARCVELCDLYDRWLLEARSGGGLTGAESGRVFELADEIGHHVPALVERVRQLEAAQQWEYTPYGGGGPTQRRRAAGEWEPIQDTEEPEK